MKNPTTTGLAGCLALAAAATATANQTCELIPNGSFDTGFVGWTFVPVTEEVGTATAIVDHTIVDGTKQSPPFDDEVALLTVAASAEGVTPDSMARAELSLSRDAVVTGPFLRVRAFGFWEALYFTAGEMSYELAAIIHGPGGEVVTQTLRQHAIDGILECPIGLSILGYTGLQPEFYVDIGATGIDPGDEVEVEIVLRAEAFAPGECDAAEMIAQILVDEIAFCDRLPCPADLDGNRVVGTGDLLELLAAWGEGPGHPADLDLDSSVGTSDLLILLAAWGACG